VSNSKTRRRRELEMERARRQADRRLAARQRRKRVLAITAGVVAVVIAGSVVAVVLTVTGGGSSTSASPTASASATAAAGTTKVGSCVYTKDTTGNVVKGATIPPSAATVSTEPATMTINTSYGTMVATLDPQKAPCTVHALYQLAQSKYFDKTTCHRETYGPEAGIYVLQCGDPTASGSGTPGFKYKNENTTGVNYNRGVLAMANSGADTNGSQFFINYANPTEEGAQALTGNYTVFGQITQGLDVLDKITSPGVVEGGSDGAPVTKPQITSITVTQAQPAASATAAPSATAAASPAPTKAVTATPSATATR
jgi:peptidyl-prolyl cis-trans isomerase B (cyclophilin B)